ncbi:MAG: T9SS type A sorting domain-containing protein [Flavobacteriales bacterium]|nr:T9SS type A sorting domain-containing protein [Flavobacteriales bacterium]
MKVFYLAFGLSLFFLNSLVAQTYQWTLPINLPDSGQITAQAVSENGDVYIASYHRTQIASYNFGLNGVFHLGEMLISKFDSNGTAVWSKTFDDSRGRIFDIELDHNNDLIICGGFYDSLKISSSVGYAGLSGYSSSFITKLDTSGTHIWSHVVISANYYQFVSTGIVINDTMIVQAGKFGIYASIRKLNTLGDTISSLQFDVLVRTISGLEVDFYGNIYICGGAFSTGYIDTVAIPDPPNNTTYLNYIAKLNSNLDGLWVRSTNYVTLDFGSKLALFGNQVAFLSNEYPYGSQGAHHFNIKYYDLAGTLLHTDSVTNAYNLDSYGTVGISTMNTHLLLTLPVGDSILQLIKINPNYQSSVLASVKCGTYVNYPLFIHNQTSLFFTTSFFTPTAVVNSIDTIYNSAGTSSYSYYSGFRELLMKFGLGPCDSTFSSFAATACGSYLSPSENYAWTTSGTYHDTILNFSGCDSIMTIELTIESNDSTLTVQACGPYTSPSGNQTWSESGTYFDTIGNAGGCDSTFTIHLTIESNDSTFTVQACEPFSSPSGNYTWSLSGTYFDTVANAAGCDSALTIHLLILSNDTAIQVFNCGPYTSPSGNIWNQSGTYVDTIQNISGCDSIISVDLTISSDSSSEQVTACYTYQWAANGNSYTSSGTYVETFINVLGCDSIATLELVIDTVDVLVTLTQSTLTANASGASYQWMRCDSAYMLQSGEVGQSFTATSVGSYAVEITQNNCVDTSACISISSLGFDAFKAKSSIELFPNPTTGNLSIEINDTETSYEVVIRNPTGQLIKHERIKELGRHDFTLEGPSGIYFVALISPLGEHHSFKVIKN